jgi:hypothetical protein
MPLVQLVLRGSERKNQRLVRIEGQLAKVSWLSAAQHRIPDPGGLLSGFQRWPPLRRDLGVTGHGRHLLLQKPRLAKP